MVAHLTLRDPLCRFGDDRRARLFHNEYKSASWHRIVACVFGRRDKPGSVEAYLKVWSCCFLGPLRCCRHDLLPSHVESGYWKVLLSENR